ncbi:hypothetical protein B7G60_14875, partial [Staphylococcus aureus]|uniref:hypothetical protein n=1 Tax=Staphylococcus aureus TaxID=1280 RepID=UPI000A2E587D
DHETDRNAHPYYVTTDTEQSIEGAKTFSSKATFTGGLIGNLTGNADTATKLNNVGNIQALGGLKTAKRLAVGSGL